MLYVCPKIEKQAMKTELIVVGRTADKHFQAGIDDYASRIAHYMSFSITVIPELRGTKNLSFEQQKEAEGALILKQLQPADTVVLLDEHGRELRSTELATWLDGQRQRARRLVFVIGGPYGFSPAVYERADAFHTAYILPRDAAGEEALLRLGLNYVRFGHEEGRLFRFLFESNQFEGMDLSGLLRGPGMNELVGVLAEGLGCGTEEAQKVFLTFFAVAHGLASLLCHNAMAYDEAECQTMLETVFCGALASMKGDTNA